MCQRVKATLVRPLPQRTLRSKLQNMKNTGYSVAIPQEKVPVSHKDHNQDEIQTKSAVIQGG